MGGGGGQSQTTETHAEYPPEFRPLAKSAVEQIKQLQDALPLVMFSGYEPAGTAGLAPLQEFAINEMVPATLRPTAGLQGGLQTPEGVGAAARGAVAAGGPTQAENAAIATLGQRLSGPTGVLPSSQALQQDFGSRLPGNYNLESVFPGISSETISGMGDMASRPTPILGGPGVSFVNPTQPGQFPDPYAATRPPFDQEGSILRLQLDPKEIRLFDAYRANGLDNRAAFERVMQVRIQNALRTQLPIAPDAPVAPIFESGGDGDGAGASGPGG